MYYNLPIGFHSLPGGYFRRGRAKIPDPGGAMRLPPCMTMRISQSLHHWTLDIKTRFLFCLIDKCFHGDKFIGFNRTVYDVFPSLTLNRISRNIITDVDFKLI